MALCTTRRTFKTGTASLAKPVLEERLSLVSSHVNDATAGALAERAYGAGRGVRHMVYMALGTGIGGGIVLDGRLYTGVRGFAGELGHLTIDRNGPVCPCGNIGCLEMLVSGTAVARIAAERLASGERSILLDATTGEFDVVDAPRVAEAARAGDALAQSIMRDVGTNLGIGLVSLLNALDPEVIVLGGGMSQSLDLLLPWAVPSDKATRDRALSGSNPGGRVRVGRRCQPAGRVGAGLRHIRPGRGRCQPCL